MTPEENKEHQDLFDSALSAGMFIITQLDENEPELDNARFIACFNNSDDAEEYLSKPEKTGIKNVTIAWDFARDGGKYARKQHNSFYGKNSGKI